MCIVEGALRMKFCFVDEWNSRLLEQELLQVSKTHRVRFYRLNRRGHFNDTNILRTSKGLDREEVTCDLQT